jgi:HEAT repeat protein
MRVQKGLVLLLCTLACSGCNRGKSTDELIADLRSGSEIDGVKAARTLPRAKEDAEKVVPALIEGLAHKGNDVRRSSALKLGEFKQHAKDAIPALQRAEEEDSDARVREAAGIALSRIDPQRFPYTPRVGKQSKPRAGRQPKAGRP